MDSSKGGLIEWEPNTMEHLAVRCDCTAFRDKEHVHCVSVHPSQRLQGNEDNHTHTYCPVLHGDTDSQTSDI